MAYKILILMLALGMVQCTGSEKKVFSIEEHTPFGVCYTKISPDQAENYKLLIIEPDFYSKEEIAEIKDYGTEVIAYVSLGEVDENRKYFPLLESRGFVGKNDNWNSSFINLEDPESRNILLNEVLTVINAKGVDGLFLDTIDAVSPVTERAYLEPYMVELIKNINSRFPDKIIIQNSGVFILEETKEYVDAFMTESLSSNYDFGSGEYLFRTADDFKDRVEYLEHHSQVNQVPYFVLDFAETQERRSKISNRLDTLGVPYFISTIGLSELPKNPIDYSNNLTAD